MIPSPWLIVVFAYGACVGSFLNVVIYRLPEGLSLCRPGSSCPSCGYRLAWYDNVPVLAWLYLRARCRSCRAPISIQYPLIEAATAVLFAGVFAAYYLVDLHPGFAAAGIAGTWPVLIVHLVLVAALLAATVIDAKLYIIPLGIPHTVTLVALAMLPATAAWLPASGTVVSAVDGPWFWAAAGGLTGLAVAFALLLCRVLPRSFDDEHALQGEGPGGPDEWLEHPHPRREVLKECLYVVWPVVGAAAGYAIAVSADGSAPTTLPPSLQVAGGVVWGYLVGGAWVWGIRILGTLAFGKEAMGLGDVHLLAAIGAVLGSFDATVVFFIAPFVGLGGTLLVAGTVRILKGQVRVVPYGPYLAAAAVVWMLFRVQLTEIYGMFFLWPQ